VLVEAGPRTEPRSPSGLGRSAREPPCARTRRASHVRDLYVTPNICPVLDQPRCHDSQSDTTEYASNTHRERPPVHRFVHLPARPDPPRRRRVRDAATARVGVAFKRAASSDSSDRSALRLRDEWPSNLSPSNLPPDGSLPWNRCRADPAPFRPLAEPLRPFVRPHGAKAPSKCALSSSNCSLPVGRATASRPARVRGDIALRQR
jgi:hypothetical protein